jgi:hypothetical protein
MIVPHHSISDARLVGRGHIPRPREVNLAHHGVFFVDKLPEFKKHALRVLRANRRRRDFTDRKKRQGLKMQKARTVSNTLRFIVFRSNEHSWLYYAVGALV